MPKILLLTATEEKFEYGHNIRDLLLIEISNRFTVSIRESDTVARLGGDEFVVLLANLPNENDYEITIRRILKYISDPVMIETRVINITASAGVSVYPRHGINYESLLKSADLAMYRVKDLEKNNFQEYNPSMSSMLTRRITLDNQLKKSIINNELLLEYQPIIAVQTGKISTLKR
ncbi:GGDEF domain-containing protein [Acetobacterium tundrae]|uniref:GGDEF domain-containing protein n=1 Tax=Acetobacterium tundrae TaxID=132932 RepID=UPI00164C5730|nr:GGDEF domain-containing protein [Acetobacterium tundrae]